MPKFLHSVVVQALFVFVCSALLATLFLSWDGFVDPDAFYHAKISQIIWENGPIQDFRWLDLTELATHPADLHLAFHLFVAPFTAVFGMFDGLRVASVLLAAACLTTFFLILRWLKLPSPILWTAFLATSPPLLLRLLLGKASPLAILLFLFGIAAAYLRKPWLVALATLAFALSHGGWIYLAGSVVLLAFGDVLFTWIVDGKPIREAVQKTLWKESLAGFAGAFIGLLIHPNFPQNILLSYTQVVRIGLGTPFQHVMLGNEWRPTEPGVLLSNYAPWIILMLLGFMGMAFAARLPLDKFRARLLVSLGWIFAVLLALTFKSRRNTEYLAPIVALWVAVLWSLVDIPRFRTQLAGMFVGRWKRVFLAS
jgi:asparagine N-glycosylation enzyme membrane subunit Stt3